MGGSFASSRSDDRRYVDAIRYAINSGINVIDTAEMYGSGHAEEIVSESIKGIDRDGLFIISKVWPTHLKYDSVIRSCNESVKRLGTYIDLYLIHWPSHDVPLSETMGAMEKLVDSGQIRNIGVSNFSVSDMEEAFSCMKKYDVSANEIEYNFRNKSAENDVIPWCEKNGVEIIAYSPLNKGDFSGLKHISEKHGIPPVKLAIGYAKRRSLPIPKGSTRDHIDEIAESMHYNIEDDVYNEIKNIR